MTKCPVCGNAVKKGTVKAEHIGSLLQTLTTVVWYPEEKCGRLKRGGIPLSLRAEGFYCEACGRVFAAFSQT